MTTAATVFALLGPVLTGWLLVKRLWPEARWGLRLGFGTAIGLALAGTAYFFALILSDSSKIALILSEAILGCAILGSFWKRSSPPPGTPRQTGSRLYACSAVIMLVLGSVAFVFAADSVRHGAWDALVMWNLRARLIATSLESPLSAIFDTAFSGLHQDYPLLVPSLAARVWLYAGSGVDAVPIALAALFTLSTIVIVIAGLGEVTRSPQQWIAGCILLGTPFLLRHGASQYADIVVCCFITAAVVLYCIYDDADEKPRHLPALAGFLAAAAACTKNEGILFIVVLFVSRVVVGVVRRSTANTKAELLRFAAGASFGLIALAVFKFFLAPPNDTIPLTTLQELAGRVMNRDNNVETVRGLIAYLDFGEWLFNPVPLMAAHVAIAWPSSRSWRSRMTRWFSPGFVLVAMSGAIYIVYLLSPYNIEAHIQSSLNRLMLQLWPTVVILYSMIVSPLNRETSSSTSKSAVLLRLLLVLAVTASTPLWFHTEPKAMATGRKTPHIDVSHREVTAGDTYFITITGVAGPYADISYSLDGEPMGQFRVYLGARGSIDFHVSHATRRGLYRFLAIRSLASQPWVPFDNDASIEVR